MPLVISAVQLFATVVQQLLQFPTFFCYEWFIIDVATALVLQLMLDLGVIRQASAGAFYLLPLGERSLQKLISIVDDEMDKIDAQKLLLPLLTPGELWKATGTTAAGGLWNLFTDCNCVNHEGLICCSRSLGRCRGRALHTEGPP
jgi:hypothetical protein